MSLVLAQYSSRFHVILMSTQGSRCVIASLPRRLLSMPCLSAQELCAARMGRTRTGPIDQSDAFHHSGIQLDLADFMQLTHDHLCYP